MTQISANFNGQDGPDGLDRHRGRLRHGPDQQDFAYSISAPCPFALFASSASLFAEDSIQGFAGKCGFTANK